MRIEGGLKQETRSGLASNPPKARVTVKIEAPYKRHVCAIITITASRNIIIHILCTLYIVHN